MGCSKPLRLKSGRIACAINTHHISNWLSQPDSVWATPFSLAATKRISIDFFSSSYSDASFRRVHVPQGEHPKVLRPPDGKSHSGILGSTAACAYPRLTAANHSLHRLPSLAIHQVASLHQHIVILQRLLTHLCTTIIADVVCYVLHPANLVCRTAFP